MGLLLFDAFEDAPVIEPEPSAFLLAGPGRTVVGQPRAFGIAELPSKDPDSIEVFNWNFKPLLADGDTVAAVVGFGFPETDGVLAAIGSGISADGFLVSTMLGACTQGRYYTARCRVSTTRGETRDLSLRFYCDDN